MIHMHPDCTLTPSLLPYAPCVMYNKCNTTLVVPPRHLAAGPALSPDVPLVIRLARRLELVDELVERLVPGLLVSFKGRDMQAGPAPVAAPCKGRALTDPPSSCPGAGESALDAVPDPAAPPSMNADAIFSLVSSCAVMLCFRRRCRNDGRWRWPLADVRGRLKAVWRFDILDTVPAAPCRSLPSAPSAPRRGSSSALLRHGAQAVRLAARGSSLFLSAHGPAYRKAGSQHPTTLACPVRRHSRASSSFSLPSRSTSDDSSCTSGSVKRKASVSCGEDSRSFRKEGG